MRALNLYFLCQIDELADFSDFENILSRRPEPKRVRENEQYSLQMLTALLVREGVSLESLDEFFFSYTIDHIGKEFDLLKLRRDHTAVLNIELKSEPVETWRISKQLRQNRYYLRHICHRIFSYTFEAENGTVYRLEEDGSLEECSPRELADCLRSFGPGIVTGIEDLFLAEDFLISPTGTPEKFLEGKYFLSPQQEYDKEQILKRIDEDRFPVFLGITGSSGTGKTLLLYDLAAELARSRRVCLVHGGQLAAGHRILEEAISNLEICSGAEVPEKVRPEEYEAILVDETQHLQQAVFDHLVRCVREDSRVGIFSFDEKRILSQVERRRGISEQVTELAECVYRLSGKIRTNKSLASFLRVFLESRSNSDHYLYRNIDVLYAREESEARRLIAYYEERGYHYVDMAVCVARSAAVPEEEETVLGADYDDMVIRLDEHFYYDGEGTLLAEANPDPNVIYDQLLFHGVTRTRNRLCVVLERNPEMFRHLNRLIRSRY